MAVSLLLVGLSLIAISGVPGILLGRRVAAGQALATALNVAGSLVGGIALGAYHLRPDASNQLSAPWGLPIGRFAVGLDAISLIFLIPMLLISALGSIYGMSYWPQRKHPGDGQKLRLCWGLMTAAMAMVVVARDGVLFLAAWEIMALAAFFLVSTEDRKPEVRQAGWTYLVAAHVGTLCLFGFFALLRHGTGSFDLWPSLPAGLPSNLIAGLLVLGVIGFGLKAGIMPLHVWLPGAHANAPSHVSAILSGVLLKTGIYGLVRVSAMLPHPPLWWGATLLLAGGLSAVFGIAFAAAQRDLKRLLAYSSIENIGIIVLGIGLASLGRSLDRPEWVVLGLGGALLHVLNHSLFKPLLFLAAGSILHATGTRQMDQLGGLAKRMPRTFVLFLTGAVAICGLPPLNGFVGEWLLYLGLIKTAVAGPAKWGWVALAAPVLTIAGAVAVVSFVKVLGSVFAGLPRTDRTDRAHDPRPTMAVPMWILAGGCVLVGLLPMTVTGLLDRAIARWSLLPAAPVASLAPMLWLSAVSLALIAVIAAGCCWLFRSRAYRSATSAGTWDCGYTRPTPRMQYTGSSISQMLVEAFAWILLPTRKRPRIEGLFPGPSKFQSDVPDLVLDRTLVPGFAWAAWLLGWARVIQRGPIQVYLLYVLAILLLLLLFA